jgi:hypothetical protein
MRTEGVSFLILIANLCQSFISPKGYIHQRSTTLSRGTVDENFDHNKVKSGKKDANKKKKDSVTTNGAEIVVNGLNNKTAFGIGGKNGISYDVNKLKTNLVQRCVADYKKQLWDLLGTPDAPQDAIESMLASIVQANPVSTTTDSNLLEGRWTFVFSSAKPAKILLDVARFQIGYKPTNEENKVIIGSLEGSTRHFALEDVEISQDPYVKDSQTWAGVVQRVRHYRVAALTRTYIEMDIFRCTWKLLGYPMWQRRYRTNRQTLRARILYIDCDLCVSVDQSLDEPFTVYTKSRAWVARTEQLKRQWKKMMSKMEQVKLRFRNHIAEGTEPIGLLPDNSIWLEYDTEQTRLKVVKLGQLGPLDEYAWEGEEDPFNNLSANERQELLKGMEIGEIEAMGKEQQIAAKKLVKKKLRLERRKNFEKPI